MAGQDKFIQMALDLGVDYCMVKPLDVDVLISRIHETLQINMTTEFKINLKSHRINSFDDSKHSCDLEEQITGIIHRVGIPASVSGYKYLREAIFLAVNDSKFLTAITKELYPSIAEKYNTTSTRVERAIRHALDCTWKKGGADRIDKLLGYNISFNGERPSNSKFIASIADNIKLENKS